MQALMSTLAQVQIGNLPALLGLPVLVVTQKQHNALILSGVMLEPVLVQLMQHAQLATTAQTRIK